MTQNHDQLFDAINYYSSRINEDPESIPSYVFRSALCETLEQYFNALKDALEVVRIDPFYWKGHHQVLKMRLKLGYIEELDQVPEMYRNHENFKGLIHELEEMKRNHYREITDSQQNHPNYEKNSTEDKFQEVNVTNSKPNYVVLRNNKDILPQRNRRIPGITPQPAAATFRHQNNDKHQIKTRTLKSNKGQPVIPKVSTQPKKFEPWYKFW